jgi:LPS export ABC transporter permease LptG/LPS export ABC transporter permease LptF
MFRILDRYLIREMLVPLVLGLVVFTFILEIPPILQQGEQLIARGAEWSVVVRVLLTLLPQALAVTIPMAVLIGILIGLGRVSADREYVAMQACGISLYRLLRPIALIAVVSTLATLYVTIVALPNANQSFREITFNVVASRVESAVKPRTFFEEFPNRVLYVRDVRPGGGWRDVFLADSSQAGRTTVYLAREGRLVIDRAHRMVELVLEHGTWHMTRADRPAEYEGTAFETITLRLDPQTVFPPPPSKGAPEMSLAELHQAIADAAARHQPAYGEHFMIQQKFSLPAACLVLAVIGLALGASARKGGKLASFVLGFAVIFVYYVLLWTARAIAIGSGLVPELAPWIPNIVLGVAAVVLLLWRARAADQPIRISLPAFWRRDGSSEPAAASPAPASVRRRRPRVVLVVRVPHLNVPRPNLLDLYVSGQYVRIFLLGLVTLLGIFYISTFMDLADKLFRGSATTGLLLRYFYFQTPQYVYYIIPMSVLLATLVTIGLMTKNSELIVMRACGISLYRTAAPLVLFALTASAVLFGLQERVLAYANREADRLNRVIRGFPPQASGLSGRRWLVGRNGDLYHYDLFDPQANRFTQLEIFHIDDSRWRLLTLTSAADTQLVRLPGADGRPSLGWVARSGWMREFPEAGRGADKIKYEPFASRRLSLESPAYFKSVEPDAEQMTYAQLRDYIARLRATGAYAVPYMVALQRKIAFPLVTLVMTLLAVPFAVTTGRRGALYGIGVGIVLAIVYWVTLSLFGALGAGGVIAPVLAAWAPNILFGAAAIYLVLTVRT